MTQLWEKTFEQQRFYFEEIFVISKNEGKQAYIFYTMSENRVHRIGMIEVLIDELRTDA